MSSVILVKVKGNLKGKLFKIIAFKRKLFNFSKQNGFPTEDRSEWRLFWP
jgi:hypothetical protein